MINIIVRRYEDTKERYQTNNISSSFFSTILDYSSKFLDHKIDQYNCTARIIKKKHQILSAKWETFSFVTFRNAILNSRLPFKISRARNFNLFPELIYSLIHWENNLNLEATDGVRSIRRLKINARRRGKTRVLSYYRWAERVEGARLRATPIGAVHCVPNVLNVRSRSY